MSYTVSPLITAAPPADADGFWHFTYITHYPDTGEWYGGKHSSNDLDRDPYIGSGNWVDAHPGRPEMITEIIEFFATDVEAYAAEAAMVTWAVIDGDPLCRNETEGGTGFTREALARITADPEWKPKQREAVARRSENPEWRRKSQEAGAKRSADPEWQRKIQERSADPEWRRKNREAAAKRSANPEWRKNHREGMAKRSDNPEWRKNHSEGMARRSDNPEWLRNTREANIRTTADPEWQRKHREAMIRLAADPEWQRKVRETNIRKAANPEWQRKIREANIVQSRNKRSNVWIVLSNGQRLILTDAAKVIGVTAGNVGARARYHGITHQEAFDHLQQRLKPADTGRLVVR